MILKYIIFLIFTSNCFCNFSFTQVFLNGDFEINSADTCDFNNTNSEFNTKIDHVKAFGLAYAPGGFVGEVDLQTHGCPYSPQSGNWCLSLASSTASTTDSDAISIKLSSDLIAGVTYRISFYAFSNSFENSIKIGYSSSETFFGMLIYTASMNNNGQWNRYEFDFTPTIGANFITVSNTANMNGWNGIDNFEINRLLSTDELINDDNFLYPNSVTSIVNIHSNTKGTILLYSTTGEFILSKKLENIETTLDISNLSVGIYYIQLLTDEKLISKSFVKF